jgi:hypothetical protein
MSYCPRRTVESASRQGVLQLNGDGELPRRKVGREYAIPRAAVEAVRYRDKHPILRATLKTASPRSRATL